MTGAGGGAGAWRQPGVGVSPWNQIYRIFNCRVRQTGQPARLMPHTPQSQMDWRVPPLSRLMTFLNPIFQNFHNFSWVSYNADKAVQVQSAP